ncbi:MAG: YitT family protein [Blautia sp.]
MKTEKNLIKRKILMAVIGIFLTSVSVAFSKLSGFGVDPFSVLMFGLAKTIGLSYQPTFIISCSILTIIALTLKKSLLGCATVISLFFSGAAVDMATTILGYSFKNPDFITRITFLIISLILVSIASALYYSANLGVSPYDAQALILSVKTPVPFRFCRIGTDLVCIAIGFLLGGDLGVGTICVAFCMGPAIQFCRERITDPLANGTLSRSHHNDGQNFLNPGSLFNLKRI